MANRSIVCFFFLYLCSMNFLVAASDAAYYYSHVPTDLEFIQAEDKKRCEMLEQAGVPLEIARRVKREHANSEVLNGLYRAGGYQPKKVGLYVLTHPDSGQSIGVNGFGVYELTQNNGKLAVVRQKRKEELYAFFEAPVKTVIDKDKALALVGIGFAGAVSAALAAWQVVQCARMPKPVFTKGLFAKRWQKRRLNRCFAAGIAGIVAISLAVTAGALWYKGWHTCQRGPEAWISSKGDLLAK